MGPKIAAKRVKKVTQKGGKGTQWPMGYGCKKDIKRLSGN